MNRAVISGMIESKSGTILNIFSASGSYGMVNDSANTAAKFAVMGITESLRQEVCQHQIHVRALTPDTINKEAIDKLGMTMNEADWMSQCENVADLALAVIKDSESDLIRKKGIC